MTTNENTRTIIYLPKDLKLTFIPSQIVCESDILFRSEEYGGRFLLKMHLEPCTNEMGVMLYLFDSYNILFSQTSFRLTNSTKLWYDNMLIFDSKNEHMRFDYYGYDPVYYESFKTYEYWDEYTIDGEKYDKLYYLLDILEQSHADITKCNLDSLKVEIVLNGHIKLDTKDDLVFKQICELENELFELKNLSKVLSDKISDSSIKLNDTVNKLCVNYLFLNKEDYK